MGRKVYSPTWNGWDFGGKVGKYDTWILWVMESYPPRPACFVKGWRYFDTLTHTHTESLERPTTLLLWWLLSNRLPLLKADSPQGFFSSFKQQFSGGEGLFHGGFGGLRFGTLRYIDLFLFGVGVGIMHVQHVLYCCCIVWWLRVVFFLNWVF